MKRDILSQIERKTKRALTDEERAAIATLLLAESVEQAALIGSSGRNVAVAHLFAFSPASTVSVQMEWLRSLAQAGIAFQSRVSRP